MEQRIVTYELFKLKCKELGMKTDSDLFRYDDSQVNLFDIKEKRHLAIIDKKLPNVFEITTQFAEEFWDYEDAKPRINLIADLAMTPIELRGKW